MMPEPPKALALILAKKKPGMSAPAKDGDDGGGDDYTAAAQDVMDALKAGDAKSFGMALHSFVQMCSHEEPDGDEG